MSEQSNRDYACSNAAENNRLGKRVRLLEEKVEILEKQIRTSWMPPRYGTKK